MPAYDYECRDCGERFTRRVPVGERDRQACPRCGSERVRRLLSPPILLGGGGTNGAGAGGGACGTAGFG